MKTVPPELSRMVDEKMIRKTCQDYLFPGKQYRVTQAFLNARKSVHGAGESWIFPGCLSNELGEGTLIYATTDDSLPCNFTIDWIRTREIPASIEAGGRTIEYGIFQPGVRVLLQAGPPPDTDRVESCTAIPSRAARPGSGRQARPRAQSHIRRTPLPLRPRSFSPFCPRTRNVISPAKRPRP